MKSDTLATHLGRDPEKNHGIVNPPVYHASTVLFPTVEKLKETERRRLEPGHTHYGRMGTPTSFAFEEAITTLEGGHGAVTASSGLGAICLALTACLKSGDHALIADTAYHPTRTFCNEVLSKYGVKIDYYDPLIGAGIEELIQGNTRVIFMESPGSLTFEVQDVPAITQAAKKHGITTMIDNTWATPLFFNPLDHGVDISIHAATKYIVGHADAMLGIIVANQRTYPTIRNNAVRFGQSAGPDDIYLGLRGLRTLPTRLRHHQDQGLRLAKWLQKRPEVIKVLHPGLEGDQGHTLWKRDFSGASGLFGVLLNDYTDTAVAAMLDGLKLFGMGYSWGGFESLILPVQPALSRSATDWSAQTPLLRIHVGLESLQDLTADLEEGFNRLDDDKLKG